MQTEAICSANKVTPFQFDQLKARKQLHWWMIVVAVVLVAGAAFLVANLSHQRTAGYPQDNGVQRHPLQLRLVMDSPSADSEQMVDVSQVGQTLYVQRKPLLDGIPVQWARACTDASTRQWYVQMALTDEAVERLNAISRANYGRRVAIVVDGRIYAAPIMKDRNFHTIAEINGNFSQQQAEDLARRISQ